MTDSSAKYIFLLDETYVIPADLYKQMWRNGTRHRLSRVQYSTPEQARNIVLNLAQSVAYEVTLEVSK